MIEKNQPEKLLLQNKYCIVRTIGQGGFGRTYLVEDGSKLNQPRCVVKQFFPSSLSNNSDQAKELFRQEAIRLKELGSHPQIPELLDYFELDGQQFLVQEFIDGQNLEEELAESSVFTETEIRNLLNDLLPVLQFVHSHQVIHRDVKPANIIRRRHDRQLALVDFGAAKYAASATVLAKTGTTIGSAEYVAPEQLAGKAVWSSDLYSLAVTCVHLLTGIPPFDLIDNSEGVWIWRDYLTQPLSEQLGQILDKLLERGTKRRYQSAAEVLQDLLATSKPSISVNSENSNASGLSFWESPLPLAITGVTCIVVMGLVTIGINYHPAPPINQPPAVQIPHHNPKPRNAPPPVIKPSPNSHTPKPKQSSQSQEDLSATVVPITRNLIEIGGILVIFTGTFTAFLAMRDGEEPMEGYKLAASGVMFMVIANICLNLLFPQLAVNPFTLTTMQQITQYRENSSDNFP